MAREEERFLLISQWPENSIRNMNPAAVPAPVLPDVDEIPRMRKMLGLTQTALSKVAGVSQSTIVKVEKRQMNPSYEIVRRIMNALEAEMQRQSKKALVEQVQTRKVQFIDAKISLEAATAEMRHFKFSQLPVFHQGRNVGSLSDKTITDLILAGKEPKELSRIRVEDVMNPPFPVIDSKAPVELAASLLRHYNAVLVTTRGDVTGILTKSDLLKLL
ncbi:MAG: CBS domain-containing protein [Methanobacteriota archaeon]|nr:MAG: CBS domain-containing protein [Euryarchaeota archaeon]